MQLREPILSSSIASYAEKALVGFHIFPSPKTSRYVRSYKMVATPGHLKHTMKNI